MAEGIFCFKTSLPLPVSMNDAVKRFCDQCCNGPISLCLLRLRGVAEQPRVLQVVSNRVLWGVSNVVCSLLGQNGPVLVLLGTDPFILSCTRQTFFTGIKLNIEIPLCLIVLLLWYSVGFQNVRSSIQNDADTARGCTNKKPQRIYLSKSKGTKI